MKITFMGAGSSVFAKNVLGDTMLCDSLNTAEIALYDIDEARLEESYVLITRLNENVNENRATIKKYLGVEQNPRYVIWAEKRLEMAETDKSIQGFENGVFQKRNT